jgi:hypothetical protein
MMYRFVSIIACALLFQTGCGNEIKDRFEECRKRVENASTENAEALNPSLSCFTKHSRHFLANLMLSQRRQGGQFEYMAGSEYQKLLGYSEMEETPTIIGDLALLNVNDGTGPSGERAVIVFAKEDGQWRIDAIELPRLWQPLNLAMELSE